MTDEKDKARRVILARRARFVAAAMAGAGAAMSCGKETVKPSDDAAVQAPMTCLTATPTPCLSTVPPDWETNDAGTIAPRVCLSVSTSNPPKDAGKKEPR